MAVANNRAVHLFIFGRVQGVFYRASTKRQADSLGLMGWVRNLPDGRVEALVQGPQSEVDTMIAWCRRGPEHSRVDEVDVGEHDIDDALTDFEIRYL
ncbi:MAG: acylphosphatase [Myxococcales bacterium]|nr:acylphosphatase [Myxococcales bacterium]